MPHGSARVRGRCDRIVAMTFKVPRGFEPRSLDSESRVLTVTPRDQLRAGSL